MTTYQQRQAHWEHIRQDEMKASQKLAEQREQARLDRLEELAKRYGSTETENVYAKRGAYSNLSKEEKAQARAEAVDLLKTTDMTQADVAKQFGVAQHTVFAWARAAGIPKYKNGPRALSEASKKRHSEKMKAVMRSAYKSAPTLTKPKKQAPKKQASALTKELLKARKELAIELMRQGDLTQQEIAEQIGVTPTTICEWAHQVGIPRRRVPKYGWTQESRARQSERMSAIQAPEPQRVQRFIELYENGAHVSDIANELCISKATVYDWVTRYQPNKEARYKGTDKQRLKESTVTYENDERVRKAVELYEAGAHRQHIAETVGIGISTVYKWSSLYADKSKRKQAKKQARSSAYKKVSHDTDKS
jgi:transposase